MGIENYLISNNIALVDTNCFSKIYSQIASASCDKKRKETFQDKLFKVIHSKKNEKQ